MGYNRIMPVEITAQTKILVSQIVLKDEVSKISSRFGITYECRFNEDDVSIGWLNPFKLKLVEEAKLSLPYTRIERIKFSIVRLPIINVLEHGHHFALDVLIQTKDSSYHLETSAFKLIPAMVDIAKNKNIQIVDPIGLIEMCSGLCREAAKEKFTPIYDNLKEQYNLQDVRTLDDRSRVNL